MSILEKLRDLVSALETGETKEKDEEKPKSVEESPDVAMPPTDEPAAVEPEPAEILEDEKAIEETPSYLECSEEETLRVTKKLDALKAAKASLAELLIAFEQRKVQLLRLVGGSTNEFYEELNSLRLEYGIPEEGYTVKLPSSLSDKVSFTKD